jgi:hypothetical protein
MIVDRRRLVRLMQWQEEQLIPAIWQTSAIRQLCVSEEKKSKKKSKSERLGVCNFLPSTEIVIPLWRIGWKSCKSGSAKVFESVDYWRERRESAEYHIAYLQAVFTLCVRGTR